MRKIVMKRMWSKIRERFMRVGLMLPAVLMFLAVGLTPMLSHAQIDGTPVPKDWSPNPAIGIVVDAEGEETGQNGRMTAPQDQRQNPAQPANVVVAVGGVLACMVEAATDTDYWEKDRGDGVIIDSAYEADGAVSYAWSAGGGSFAAATNRSTNWTAPNTPGEYTLSCKIDDPHADGQNPAVTGVGQDEIGTRNDAAITRSVNVTVVKVNELTVANATVTVGNASCYVSLNKPTTENVVVTATLDPNIAAGNLPPNFITWTGGQPGANQLQRIVSKNVAATTTLTATAGISSKAVIIHVVNADASPAVNTAAALSHILTGTATVGAGAFGLTVITIGQQGVVGPEFDITAYLDGSTWRFRVTAIRHRYKVGVHSLGRTNIASGTDPIITTPPNTKAAVIADLTPPAAGAGHGPPRTTYWSEIITRAHEQAHVDRFYAAPFWATRMGTFETEVEAQTVNFDCAVTNTQTAAAVITAQTAAWRTRINALHGEADTAEITGSEGAAHNVSNPMYTALINSIP